jgi:hypothetical protein
MRVAHLQYVLILAIIIFAGINQNNFVQASEGTWIRNNYDYTGIFQTLAGYEEWNFNTTRGPSDRWVINLTISGYGFNPTTVLVCNQFGYNHWKQTGSTTECALAEAVNLTLDTAVNLTQQSNWFFVLINTSAGTLFYTLFYTLFITHYWWSTELPPTGQPDNYSFFGPLGGYLIILCIICFLIVPCLCNFSCIGRCRRGSRKKGESKEIHHHYHLVEPPDSFPANQILDDEEEQW